MLGQVGRFVRRSRSQLSFRYASSGSSGESVSSSSSGGGVHVTKRERLTLDTFATSNPTLCPIPVKWGDMDAFNHVNNTVYFKYFEEARIKLFYDLMEEAANLGEECEATINWGDGSGGVGPILAHTECSFKFPTTYPDKLVIGARIDLESLTSNQFIMHYTAWSRRHSRPVATGTGKIIAYDYVKGHVTELPDALIKSIFSVHAKVKDKINKSLCSPWDLTLERDRSDMRVYTVTGSNGHAFNVWEVSDADMDAHFGNASGKKFFDMEDARGKLITNVDLGAGWKYKRTLRWNPKKNRGDGSEGIYQDLRVFQDLKHWR
jgi:acyl-CoA thioester hydrolase